ncbi:hypothetical protein JTE90_016423 [Oedothorax gibbosus]|uniref:Uncharacterized protein n=1 Tax=Oedothorax gibbosus TaxID=931172 RepID=A0AAV6TCS6_9ARAC|nr:hypothetical protein JTE90_016423 [Oedothorax gibbosus]
MCASQWVLNKPGGEMKDRPGEVGRIRDPLSPRGGGRPGRPAAFLGEGAGLSAHLGPEDVNYARQDEAKGKLGWGRTVLTLKIDRQSGSSGVRQQTSSSCSPPSFPRDSWRSLNFSIG